MKYLLSTCALLFLLMSGIYLYVAFYIGKNATNDTKIRSSVILVLGAKSFRGNSYNPCLISRINHAVSLYKKHYASKLLFSGGFDKEDHVSEAKTMQAIALSQGIPKEDILLEMNSTSTYENILFSQKILFEKGLSSMIIVTEPFHSPRAALVAKKLGLSFTVSPAPDSSCWLKKKYISKYFLKEPLAIIFYKIHHRI